MTLYSEINSTQIKKGAPKCAFLSSGELLTTEYFLPEDETTD